MGPCDICIEEECEGKKNCNYSTCSHKDSCPKRLQPTIRITNKCTQSCAHCCWESSPQKNTHMSVATSEVLHSFLSENEINNINLMGGEIPCNPDWKQIIDNLAPGIRHIRFVTNGDSITHEVLNFLKSYSKIKISISEDQWHNTRNVKKAAQLCKQVGIPFNIATQEETTEDSIVPTGRSEFSFGLYSMFSSYCHKPERRYSFLIDEAGDIYKCPFGHWRYTNISEHQDGSFPERFKEMHQKFHKAFIPNCRVCIRSSQNNKRSIRL